MTRQIISSHSKLDKVMNPDQFDQVVEAILAGKYSWACVLILRFAGYNPLHYIPYRTYNRLLKENCQVGRASRQGNDSIAIAKKDLGTMSNVTSSNRGLNRINELDYLERVDKQSPQIKGGSLEHYLDLKFDMTSRPLSSY
ncbi:MAG: HetP family heterocyst commitment protein [Chroococcidiopsidaceae cyanobacterium CP_BM_ER_R8_30]|nr:HetP family heterocyst commitment protein [Chroococcidiopsidaceae cyanobacterium CP_BM_ER_R8_30]